MANKLFSLFLSLLWLGIVVYVIVTLAVSLTVSERQANFPLKTHILPAPPLTLSVLPCSVGQRLLISQAWSTLAYVAANLHVCTSPYRPYSRAPPGESLAMAKWRSAHARAIPHVTGWLIRGTSNRICWHFTYIRESTNQHLEILIIRLTLTQLLWRHERRLATETGVNYKPHVVFGLYCF